METTKVKSYREDPLEEKLMNSKDEKYEPLNSTLLLKI